MFTVKKPSRYRLLANNVLSLSDRTCYPIHLNIEVDATNIFQLKKECSYSINTILTHTIASTLKEDSKFNVLNSVYQKGLFGSQLVMYDHVSYSLALDRQFEGEYVACIYILEDVDTKDLATLDKEVKAINRLEVKDLKIYQLLSKVMALPSWLQRLVLFLSGLFPRPGSVTFGSVGFTNLGKGSISSVFPVSPKTIIFGIGGFSPRVVMQDEKPVEHQFLTISMTFNHFVVDGRICNEFLTALKNRLENI